MKFNAAVKIVILGLLLAIISLGALNWSRLPTYKAHFAQKHPHTEMRYAELSAKMDEAAIRKHFEGLSLECRDHPPGTGIGDRACHSDVDSVNGLPALEVILFLSRGQLVHSVVHVPWWAHGRWRDNLVKQYGKAHRSGLFSYFVGPIVQWDLPNGALIYNRERSFNPLEWSAVYFTAGKI